MAGATGVFGRRVVRLLTEAGHEVTAVARGPEKAALLHSLCATPMAVDLFDPAAVAQSHPSQPAFLRAAQPPS